jgi:hypothetical protein
VFQKGEAFPPNAELMRATSHRRSQLIRHMPLVAVHRRGNHFTFFCEDTVAAHTRVWLRRLPDYMLTAAFAAEAPIVSDQLDRVMGKRFLARRQEAHHPSPELHPHVGLTIEGTEWPAVIDDAHFRHVT